VNKWISVILTAAPVGVLLFGSVAAKAAPTYDFAAAILTENNNCLIPGGDRAIYVMKCKEGGARYSIVEGRVRTSDGFCFDHGVV
jgi:hypothetical protein